MRCLRRSGSAETVYAMKQEHGMMFSIKMIVLSLFAVTTLFPFGWVLLSSFKTTSEIYGNSFGLPAEWQFGNYVTAWKGAGMAYSFLNTIFYTTTAVAAVLIITSMVSYVIVRSRFGRHLYHFFAFGLMLPIHSVIIPLNVLVNKMGLTGTRFSLILIYVVLNTSFSIFIISAFMRQIPMDFEEAATIDGCSRFRVFWQIMIPMSRPALITAGTLAFVSCWNDLILSMVFISKRQLNTLNYSIFMLKSQYVADYGAITAGLVISIVPLFCLYVIFQEQIVRGMLSGAVKG